MNAAAQKPKPVEYRCPCLNGAMLKAPVYETHYRGSNWLAVIDVDGTSPGGLSRRFLPYGKGDCLYLIEQVALFDAVEFGADYTTSVGRKKPHRLYGFVVALTPTEIVIRECASGADACIAAQAARTSTPDKVRALEEAKAAHLESAKKLDEEIAALKER